MKKGEWQIKNSILHISVLNRDITPVDFGITFGVTVEDNEITKFTDNVIFFVDEDGYEKSYVRIKE